ncbi:hypothetical protein BCV70DRAFT_47614 [Testicularia cyperi]|uniref:Uncharacterized protein n=1 Tax=Testicularia cyperi TaxID=1882483 RepID=A0A317XHE3_9BASI|nr:hypothetical protein BCV70DRAFT_47614 [Testicularia cyperi]
MSDPSSSSLSTSTDAAGILPSTQFSRRSWGRNPTYGNIHSLRHLLASNTGAPKLGTMESIRTKSIEYHGAPTEVDAVDNVSALEMLVYQLFPYTFQDTVSDLNEKLRDLYALFQVLPKAKGDETLAFVCIEQRESVESRTAIDSTEAISGSDEGNFVWQHAYFSYGEVERCWRIHKRCFPTASSSSGPTMSKKTKTTKPMSRAAPSGPGGNKRSNRHGDPVKDDARSTDNRVTYLVEKLSHRDRCETELSIFTFAFYEALIAVQKIELEESMFTPLHFSFVGNAIPKHLEHPGGKLSREGHQDIRVDGVYALSRPSTSVHASVINGNNKRPREAKPGHPSDKALTWSDAVLLAEVKTVKNRESKLGRDLAQLITYVVNHVGSSPGFQCAFGMTLVGSLVQLYRFDCDHITFISRFDADSNPRAMALFSVFLCALQLDSYNGYLSNVRCLDLASLEDCYVLDAQRRAHKLVIRASPQHLLDWHGGSLSHRYTIVAVAEVVQIAETRHTEPVSVILKATNLPPEDRFIEGLALSQINAFLDTVINGSVQPHAAYWHTELRLLLKRLRHCVPRLIASGELLLPMRPGSGLECLRQGNVKSPAESVIDGVDLAWGGKWPYRVGRGNGLYTVMTGQNTRRVMTLTTPTATSQVCEELFWQFPAAIANVIEMIMFVNRPANVVHADISLFNICLFNLNDDELRDLLDPEIEPHKRPPVVSLIDYGESWVDGKCGQRSQDDPRRYVSGTHLFWATRSYENQKILDTLRTKPDETLDDAQENWYKGLKAKLQPLQAIDDVESAILVLAFGMALLLRARRKNTMGVKTYTFRRWMEMSRSDRFQHYCDPDLRTGHLVSLFYGDKPEPPNNQSLDQQYSEDDMDKPNPAKLIRIIGSMVFDALTSLDAMLQVAKEEETAHSHNNGKDAVALKALALIERLYEVTRQLYPFRNIKIDEIYA